MDGWMYIFMDGRIDDQWLDRMMNGLVGLMDRWAIGWTEQWMEYCMSGIMDGWRNE